MICFVPSRAGSKRLPNKGTRLLGGRALYEWTLQATLDSDVYDQVVVCTDDTTIMEGVSRNWPQVRLLTRDPVPDSQADLEWLVPVVEAYPCEAFSLARITSPFRSAQTIQRAMAEWVAVEDQVDSMRAVRKVSEHPLKCWVPLDSGPFAGLMRPYAHWHHITPWGDQPYNRPTQDLETVLIQTAGIEFSWTRNLEDEEPSISGDRVAPFLVSGPEALDCNTLEEWWIAERYVAEGLV